MENKIKKALDPIHADAALKQSTREFLYKQAQNKNPKRMSRAIPATAAALACTVILFLGVSNFYTATAQAAYMELDGEVQLGISINAKDKVLSVTGLNKAGERVAASVNTENMSYRDALEAIFTSSAFRKYSSKDVGETVTVTGKDEEQASEIKQEAKNLCQQHHQNGHHSSESPQNESDSSIQPENSGTQTENQNSYEGSEHSSNDETEHRQHGHRRGRGHE